MARQNARTPRRAEPVLFERQRLLLVLLDALGGAAGSRDFQLLLFLYCQEPESGSPYEFVPHELGAFSFTLYADRRKLVDHGFLAEGEPEGEPEGEIADEHRWQLTDQGRRAIGSTRDPRVAAFVRRMRGMRGNALVAETYRRFPYYAIRSEIAGRVLGGDRAALKRIEAARPVAPSEVVFTIGYQGRTLEGYLNELLRSCVTLLCDVRGNPNSRKWGFSKGTLANACEEVGIRYEHLPALGIATEKRRRLETQADYDALFAEYARKTLPKQTGALTEIAAWVHAGERIALTCYELQPRQCHRSRVAEALERRFGKGLAAKHLI